MTKFEGTMNSTTFLWIIHDAHSSPISTGNSIRSSTFPPDKTSSKKWHLSLSLNPRDNCLQPKVHFYTNEKVVNFEANVTLSLLNVAFCVVAKKKKAFRFTGSGEYCPFYLSRGATTPTDKCATSSERRNIALRCEITILEKYDQKNDDDCISTPNCILLESLNSLRKEAFFSDFLVLLDDRQYSCHKFMLACRSEYFSAMFRHNMKETNENKLFLSDLKPDIFQKLITYIYTGQVDVRETEAFDLFLAADRFQLERLKRICEERIHSFLCVENASEIFLFASVYNIQTLKLNAFHFLDVFVDRVTLVSDLGKTHACFVKSQRDPETSNEFETGVEEQDDVAQSLEVSVDKLATVQSTVSALKSSAYEKKTFVPKADFWGYTVKKVLPVCKFVAEELEIHSPFKVLCSHMVICSHAMWKIEICTVPEYVHANYLYLYMYLIWQRDENYCFSLEYSLQIYDNKQQMVNKVSGVCNCELYQCCEVYFMPVDAILSNKRLICEDGIHLRCNFTAWESVVYKYTLPGIPKCDLTDNLLSALEDKKFTDLSVKIQDEVFSCHKGILASKIPYFASLFLEETCSETVELDDIEPNAFRKILSSLYTGLCEFDKSEVGKLVSVCDKYSLLNISSNFVDVYISTLRVSNCTKILLFADRHNAEKVKKCAIEFIARNMEKVVESEGWSLIAKQENLIPLCFEAYVFPDGCDTIVV